MKNILFSHRIVSILLLLFSLIISMSLGSLNFLGVKGNDMIPNNKEGYEDTYHDALRMKKDSDERAKYELQMSNAM